MSARPLWTTVLAVVAPLATALALGAGLLSVEDSRDQTSIRLAGKEVEGKVRPEGVVAYVRQQMNRAPQRAVILGDSLAHADVHHEPFCKQLDTPPRTVARMSIPGSGAPTWYAVLDNHVFGPGHRPEWIVVVASLPSMLQLAPDSPAQQETLRTLMDGDDPLLEARLDSWRPSLWTDLLTARVKAKQRWIDAVRGGAVGWLFAPPEVSDRTEWGARRADAASARVIDRRRIDLHLSRAVSGTLDPRLEALPDAEDLPSVDDSWIPALIELARAHGSKIAFVKPPMSPQMPPEGWDRVPEHIATQLEALSEAPDVVVLDDSRLPVPPNGFRDEAHMGEALSRRYGMLVASRLALDLSTAPTGRSLLPDAERASAEPSDWPVQPVRALSQTIRWDLGALRPIVDRMLIAGTQLDAACLPLQVVHDEQVIEPHPDGCAGLMNDPTPSTCFDGTHLWARTDPPQSPSRLTPHPTGSCPEGQWLHPGDRLSIDLPAQASVTLSAVSSAPLQLVLTHQTPSGSPARLPWTPGKLSARRTFELPGDGPSTLQLRNASASIVFVSQADLTP